MTILILLVNPVSGNGFVVADDINYEGSIDILPNDHQWQGSFDGQYDGMYGKFEVTSGTDITFFILTQSDWDKYHNQGSDDITKIHLIEDVSSGIINFRLPQTALWYYVFDNSDDATNTQHVVYEIYKDMTAPEIELNLVAGNTYSGTTEVNVDAIDANFDISTIVLYIDDIQEDSEVGIEHLSFDWDTTSYTDGQHTIKVVAKDNVKSDAGTVGNTAELEIIVSVDNTNPTSSTVIDTTTSTITDTTTTSSTGDSGGLDPQLKLAAVGASATVTFGVLGFIFKSELIEKKKHKATVVIIGVIIFSAIAVSIWVLF